MGVDRVNRTNLDEKQPFLKLAKSQDFYINCVFNEVPKSDNEENLKETLYEKALKLPDDIREKFLEYIEKGSTSRDFIDMLNERYAKKQAEFEEAWEEYQEAKNNLKLLRRILEITTKRYANSDSDFELGRIKVANKNYIGWEGWVDILLSKAGDIAHRIIG